MNMRCVKVCYIQLLDVNKQELSEKEEADIHIYTTVRL